ncbi:unnamed protein product [Vitrella brassicaformis CCMP3155]|uniref:Palmitoyltransferase n=2 Tax=Vitrella brassicaformis TaxID=1169539 RepID=A0A0G4F072_VITBC|nr:unnamed protein product [Vitrella brassicaformis CCMP3155]|eukprot:CEM05287.1 unnamed protein product [Vitrella brassicaformis CCMP3155]
MEAYGVPEGRTRPRRGEMELAKLMPVVFVLLIILTLYSIFVLLHCVPLLQLDLDTRKRNDNDFYRGVSQLFVFHVLTVLLFICYARAIISSPGKIPDDKEWQYPAADSRYADQLGASLETTETKRSGERRHCKWCGKFKPDRCHHCRVCRTCVLKMDHHCPWIYNCVGFGNHKYFFLLLLYSTLACHFISWAMFESVKKYVIDEEAVFHKMFFLLFGETLAAFMGVLLTAFFGFHIWLVSRGMTTIEFCEKSTKRGAYGGRASSYDRGCLNNFLDVVGPDPIFWLLPFGRKTGNGLAFVSESTRLIIDIEGTRAARADRRRSRRSVGRVPRRPRKGIPGMESVSESYAEQEEAAAAAAHPPSGGYGAAMGAGLGMGGMGGGGDQWDEPELTAPPTGMGVSLAGHPQSKFPMPHEREGLYQDMGMPYPSPYPSRPPPATGPPTHPDVPWLGTPPPVRPGAPMPPPRSPYDDGSEAANGGGGSGPSAAAGRASRLGRGA